MKLGWWYLTVTEGYDLTEGDCNHIADMVREGFMSGQLIREEENEEEDE